jgi:steroid delta-isomerase-like uncharacterized protein
MQYSSGFSKAWWKTFEYSNYKTVIMKTAKVDSSTIEMNEKSMAEKNKILLHRAVKEIWNDGKFDNLEEFVSPDFVAYSTGKGEDVHGLDGARRFWTDLRRAFPDIHFTIIHQVAEGDRVVTHWSASGTHKGEFKGIKPTGKKFTITSIDIDRIVDGKVTECWSSMDELGLLQQLGVIPTTDQNRS